MIQITDGVSGREDTRCMRADVFESLKDEETENIRLLRLFYRADWADPASRALAIAELRGAALPGFTWEVSARFPPLSLQSESLVLIGEGIEQDYSSYVRRPEERQDNGSEELVLYGWMVGRTRASREEVRRGFEDRWTFEGDRPVRLVSS